jgi:hypothetical protein
MAAMTDLANPAAAVSAGYAKVQIDRGVPSAQVRNPPARYVTLFEKWLTGEPGKIGFNLRAYGEDNSSAANADTAALAQLNSKRNFRYGKGANQNAGGLPGNSGFQHTVDVT